MPTDVLEVTKRFMRDPVRILVKKEELTLEGIRQFYVQVDKEVGCFDAVVGLFFCLGEILKLVLIQYIGAKSMSPVQCL